MLYLEDLTEKVIGIGKEKLTTEARSSLRKPFIE